MSKRVKNKLKNSLNTSQIKKIKHSKWTPKEDEKLKYLAKLNNYKNWKQISNQIKGRTAVQCQQRWNKILQPGLVKGPWSAYEDKILIEWVNKYGPIKWTLCSNNIPGRTGKQCREHWNNVLNNDIKKGEWTIEEDFLIMNFYKKYNGSWKKLIEIFDKRTENSIKNRFFSQLRKIATKNMSISERKLCPKIKLEELKNHLNEAISQSKNEFLNENKMKEEETIINVINNLPMHIKISEEFKNLIIDEFSEEGSEMKINKLFSIFIYLENLYINDNFNDEITKINDKFKLDFKDEDKVRNTIKNFDDKKGLFLALKRYIFRYLIDNQNAKNIENRNLIYELGQSELWDLKDINIDYIKRNLNLSFKEIKIGNIVIFCDLLIQEI